MNNSAFRVKNHSSLRAGRGFPNGEAESLDHSSIFTASIGQVGVRELEGTIGFETVRRAFLQVVAVGLIVELFLRSRATTPQNRNEGVHPALGCRLWHGPD